MGNVWAGVVRVSFVGGRGGDRFHAEREQIEEIQRGVSGIKGAQLELLPSELDVSGGLPLEQRPSLLRAVEGVENGTYAGVIVAYLSRLGRSVSEQLRAWDRVEAAGGRIVVVREGIDTSTPTGRMLRTILLAVAEMEREQHVERFEERRRHATASGVWQRHQVPTGYVRDPETRRLIPGGRAGDVRDAFGMSAAGEPVIAIGRRLNLTASGARHLLRNRVYLGELRVGAHVNTGAHEPLVSLELFDAAQPASVRPARSGRHTAPALLAGIVRCQACGHVMTRTGGRGVTIYVCPPGSKRVCPAPASITGHRVDEHVTRIVLPLLDRLHVTASQADAQITEARAVVADAEGELVAYLQATAALDVSPDALRAGAEQRQAAVDEARSELRRREALRPVTPGVETGGEAWEGLDGHGRNALLRALLEVVVVRKVGRGRTMPVEDRVRVVAHGTGLPVPRKRGDVPIPVTPLPFLDLDVEGVLGVPGSE